MNKLFTRLSTLIEHFTADELTHLIVFVTVDLPEYVKILLHLSA